MCIFERPAAIQQQASIEYTSRVVRTLIPRTLSIPACAARGSSLLPLVTHHFARFEHTVCGQRIEVPVLARLHCSAASIEGKAIVKHTKKHTKAIKAKPSPSPSPSPSPASGHVKAGSALVPQCIYDSRSRATNLPCRPNSGGIIPSGGPLH